MHGKSRPVLMQLVGGAIFIVAFAIAIVAAGEPALITLLIPAPFAMLMLWLALQNDDFRFGQHDEDTPYAPSDEQRAAISYRELDRIPG